MSERKKLIIIGMGETACLAYEYFTHDSEYEVVAFAVEGAYYTQPTFYDLPVCRLEEIQTHYPPNKFTAFVALSSGRLNRDRTKLYLSLKEKGYQLASYVSSKAFVWHNVKIGENCFILENNTLQPFVEVGNNVILWSGNHIGHRSKILDHCFITSHVVISGFCTVGEYSFLGVNSAIADNTTLAKDNFIGMGAVINKNTDENTIYTGNPAQPSKLSAKKFCKVKES
ncbi:acetyltransferase [Entomomonas moraniae]|uniref:Acetyltransferase n=1 Tax=Entomomonas moraniae TaxID=2213226 RepID=A0A3S9XB12_9GAMM|nr:acetyltransferase [Entomomonas moraniae]AZS49634.1 acetyltransferase [Entomomonas moraniae]